MANTTVGVEIKVNGNQAEQSVGSFKKRLREANAELVTLSEKFGATSKEAINAAKNVAKLKDAIGDAKQLADAFSPDAKFQAFAGAIQGAVSGFAALQGAQALFGTESEELNKTLVKVQGALALSQGLNGILAAKDAFVNLGAVIKSSVITAFGSLRAAIISTGIGALVIGVTALIANFDDWFGANEDVIDSQKALKDATEDLTSALKPYYDEIDRTVRIEQLRAKIAGKSIEDADTELLQLQQKIKLNQQLLELSKGTIFEQAANIGLTQEIAKLETDLAEKRLKRQADIAQKNRDEAKKEADLQKASFDKLSQDTNVLIAKRLDSQRGVLDETKSVLSGITQASKDANAQQIDDEQARAASITAIRQDSLKQIIAADEAEAESKRQTVASIATSTEALSNAIGKQTAVGKALGVATALINTYQGASEVLRAKSTLPEPFATISKIANVAAIIATGIRSVKAITAVKVPGGGGGGSAPSIQPLTPTAQTTRLDQSSINSIGQASSRAFVLDRDVTNNQERTARLNRAARIN